MPNTIPEFDSEFINNLHSYDTQYICVEILKKYFSPEISVDVLKKIVEKSINFDILLHRLHVDKFNIIDNEFVIENIPTDDHVLELFHGPTMAFKDFGARVLAQIYDHLFKGEKYEILVATSGDTGSAVADAFYGTSIKVNIFYPTDKISAFQEYQITKFGKHIRSFSVNGSFDDCQMIVKKLIPAYKNKYISANSINIARLIPQIFYYFISYAKLQQIYKKFIEDYKIVYTIPSGNLGNATACLLSKKMGLPIDQITVACNINSIFPKFIKTGRYQSCETKSTISNAMDVCSPNNLPRMMEIYDERDLLKFVKGYTITDDQTRRMMLYSYVTHKYVMDPHTAVAYAARNMETRNENEINVILATASPLKFKETVEDCVPINIDTEHNSITETAKDTEKIEDVKETKTAENIENVKDNKPLNDVKENNTEYDIQRIIYNSIDTYIFEKLQLKNIIILIGMPGSGKTSISKELKKFDWDIIDTDALIEEKYEKKLIDVVNEHKDNFTDVESSVILNNNVIYNVIHNTTKKTIISTGGSVVYCDKLMSYFRDIGTIIYLQAEYANIEKRITNIDNRGIYTRGLSLSELYDERSKLYIKYGELIINTSIINIETSVQLINNLM